MDDLTLAGFLAARLDEDFYEAVKFSGDPDWSPEVMTSLFARHPSDPIIWHIARHDPARVLREVEAGRKILALHQITTTYADSRDDDYRPVKIPEVQCYVCGWASDAEGSACETLRGLAAVYSDHPDYREEWKP